MPRTPTVKTEDGTLEPGLTKLDRRVLDAVPSHCAHSIWTIGEKLQIIDVSGELLPVLRGLEHFGLIEEHWSRRSLSRWARTRRGDEALAGGKK